MRKMAVRFYICQLIILLTMISGRVVRAEAKIFQTASGDPKNLIQFTSKATLETVVGHTSHVSGHADINLDSVMATQDAQFDVDLNTLDTGINMRNNDMRRDFLETAKYPTATFKLTRFVSSDKPTLQPGETVHAVVEGDFTVHGVAKTYQIPITMVYGTGDNLTVTGEWIVKLEDHNIQRPQLLLMRLAPEQHVSIRIGLIGSSPSGQ